MLEAIQELDRAYWFFEHHGKRGRIAGDRVLAHHHPPDLPR
jgi:hypothetical protein